MSETKIQVPEGMLKAIRGRYVGNDNCGRYILEAALRWLSENPIVPTDGEAKAIWRDTGLCNEVDDDELRCIVVEWQRRMFLAPDGPDVSQWTCQLSGYTFTQEEADAICEYVRTASHPIRAGFNGEPVASNVEFTNALKAVQGEAPEPEVPEAVKDLLVDSQAHLAVNCDTFNEAIFEAYRRGRESTK